MYSKEEQQEQLYFEKVKSFLNSEIIRLKDLIVTYKARVKAQGEKFNEDNPNGGMYAGVELTELHYEMENQLQEIENAHYDISFYEKLKNSPYFARVDFTLDLCVFSSLAVMPERKIFTEIISISFTLPSFTTTFTSAL